MNQSHQEVRKLWQSFWESKSHILAKPASVIPSSEDKTVLFNTSGMQQFVPFLLGKPHPQGKRLYNIQRCLRTNDIDDIGDERHCSLFEMMGNRSLGDYFKHESIQFTIEFLTKVVGIPLEKIGATIYQGDDTIPKDEEVIGILLENGIPQNKIIACGEDNFRGPPGKIGPCGPCCEFYYDRGDLYGPANRKLGTNDRYTEIWNNVFMEYYKDDNANFTKLSQHNVDTGMGFERLCMVLQEKETIFETDIFSQIIGAIEDITQINYPSYRILDTNQTAEQKDTTKSFRIISDHMRAACISIMDGVTISNEGRGYVLRRLIRRMFYHIKKLSTVKEISFTTIREKLSNIINAVVLSCKDAYPELEEKQTRIHSAILNEIEQFETTIQKGEKMIFEIIKTGTKTISGKDALLLHETYGMPIELTKEVAASKGVLVDEKGFYELFEKVKEQSRTNQTGFKKDIDWSSYIEDIPKTQFIGYENLASDNMNLLKTISVTLNNEEKTIMIFDKTPFYAEGGGQTGDYGKLIDNNQTWKVTNVIQYGGIYLHIVEKF